LFERVRAAAQRQQCDCERDRKGLHLLIVILSQAKNL
jgi:hypothetical protein